jgi:hypothetical protein
MEQDRHALLLKGTPDQIATLRKLAEVAGIVLEDLPQAPSPKIPDLDAYDVVQHPNTGLDAGNRREPNLNIVNDVPPLDAPHLAHLGDQAV